MRDRYRKNSQGAGGKRAAIALREDPAAFRAVAAHFDLLPGSQQRLPETVVTLRIPDLAE